VVAITEPNFEVRLGAIYALEKLAREDLDLHWPIMETLCAYIRQNAGPAQIFEKNVANKAVPNIVDEMGEEKNTKPVSKLPLSI